MPEMRVSRLIIVAILVAVIALPLLVFGGIIGGFWFITKENMDKGVALAKGYTTAKDPAQAMDKFREAIHNRDYKSASYYCTKSYSEMLKRSHDGAAEIGADIDKIRKFGDNSGIMTDKLTIALHRLDPFPKNFKLGPPLKVNDKAEKAKGIFLWDPLPLKNPSLQLPMEVEVNKMDPAMYQNVLAPAAIFAFEIELVREGEEWKLNVPTNQPWELTVNIFNDKYKTYHTGLSAFTNNMTRELYADKATFENGAIEKLRAAGK
jgi:hypothetical protein